MKKLIKIITILYVMATLLSACGKELSSRDYSNSVTTLNVGQANCTLIQSGDSYRLIDRGRADGGVDIKTYLNHRGVKKIDVFVISHFHYDHTSEAMDVIRGFDIGTVVIPSLSAENIPDTYFYKSLLEDSANGFYSLEYTVKGKSFTVGEGSITVLADTINSENINNTSVVLEYTQGDFTYVNTADIESDVDSLITDNLPQDVDLFLASHHGSKDANSPAMLEKLSPELTVISRGKDNDYGHPHPEFLNRLDELNIPYITTFEQGNIVYDINSKDYFVD